MKIAALAFLIFFYSIPLHSQNLLVNPSAESGDPTSVGWTNVAMGSTGASCYNNTGWRIMGNQNGFPAAQQGSYIFYAGCSPTNGPGFELRQDVNVSLNAAVIDAGWNSFTFSGYMQVYNQSPADESQMIVEYRDALNTTVLSSYNTGLKSDIGSWKFYISTITSPAGTRYIRVRLITVAKAGPSVDGYFDNLSLSTNIALPIVLSAFNVTAGNGVVKLSWTTASELTNSYFTIQRSADGTAWQDLQKIEGSANSTGALNYVAFDNNPLPGISYYRLKQTDVDGNPTYSEIKEVNLVGGFDDIIVFPNPVKNIFTVSGGLVKNAQLSLYNSMGQVIIPPFTIRDNQVSVNVSGISSGVYFMRLSNGSATQVKKIFIQ